MPSKLVFCGSVDNPSVKRAKKTGNIDRAGCLKIFDANFRGFKNCVVSREAILAELAHAPMTDYDPLRPKYGYPELVHGSRDLLANADLAKAMKDGEGINMTLAKWKLFLSNFSPMVQLKEGDVKVLLRQAAFGPSAAERSSHWVELYTASRAGIPFTLLHDDSSPLRAVFQRALDDLCLTPITVKEARLEKQVITTSPVLLHMAEFVCPQPNGFNKNYHAHINSGYAQNSDDEAQYDYIDKLRRANFSFAIHGYDDYQKKRKVAVKEQEALKTASAWMQAVGYKSDSHSQLESDLQDMRLSKTVDVDVFQGNAQHECGALGVFTFNTVAEKVRAVIMIAILGKVSWTNLKLPKAFEVIRRMTEVIRDQIAQVGAATCRDNIKLLTDSLKQLELAASWVVAELPNEVGAAFSIAILDFNALATEVDDLIPVNSAVNVVCEVLLDSAYGVFYLLYVGMVFRLRMNLGRLVVKIGEKIGTAAMFYRENYVNTLREKISPFVKEHLLDQLECAVKCLGNAESFHHAHRDAALLAPNSLGNLGNLYPHDLSLEILRRISSSFVKFVTEKLNVDRGVVMEEADKLFKEKDWEKQEKMLAPGKLNKYLWILPTTHQERVRQIKKEVKQKSLNKMAAEVIGQVNANSNSSLVPPPHDALMSAFGI